MTIAQEAIIGSDDTISSVQREAPEGGWGWFIVFSANVNVAFFDGMIASTAVLLVRMKTYFNEGAGRISLIASIGMFVVHSSAPIAVFLSKKYGARCIAMIGGILCAVGLFLSGFVNNFTVLCLTLAVLTNFGMSMSFAPTFALLGQYFHSRLGLANGLAASGYGIGVMGLPPLTQLLIYQYGWQGTCIVLSGLVSHLCLVACLLRPLNRTEDTKLSKQTNNHCLLHICIGICRFFGFHILWVKPLTIGVFMGILFMAASNGTFFTFLLQRTADIGIDATDGALLMTVIGASSIVIRLTHGWFIDLRLIAPICITAGSLTVWGLSNLVFTLVNEYNIIVFFCVVFGLTSGLQNSLSFVIVKDFVQTELYPSAVGLLLWTFGTGSFIGISTAGAMYDIHGTANVTFCVSGTFGFIAALALTVTHCVDTYCRRQTVDTVKERNLVETSIKFAPLASLAEEDL